MIEKNAPKLGFNLFIFSAAKKLDKNNDCTNSPCLEDCSNSSNDSNSLECSNDLKPNADLVGKVLVVDHDSDQDSKFKFRHPRTRNELASYYLHFMGPKPFYKTYSYV